MSTNLHLSASVIADIHLKHETQSKKITESLTLYHTPTHVTERILNSLDPYAEYVVWLREIEPNDTVTYGVVHNEDFGEDYYAKEEYEDTIGESGIPWDELPKVEEPTFRIEHEKELRKWLTDHDGWEIEWYGI